MGQLASTRIRELISANPAQEFAYRLVQIADELAQARPKVPSHAGVSDSESST